MLEQKQKHSFNDVQIEILQDKPEINKPIPGLPKDLLVAESLS